MILIFIVIYFQVIEVSVQPINSEPEIRPPFNFTQKVLVPVISAAMQKQVKELTASKGDCEDENIVKIGQSCKRGACKASYTGPESDGEVCVHHPGAPIFHEGMKYWSCCQKKTTDFGVFLSQPGCTEGNHLWMSKVK